MGDAPFIPEPGVSYSAGVAYVVLRGSTPQLLLVLQKSGEQNAQKSGNVFVEPRVWKMPMGHFDATRDGTLSETAEREFAEETGLELSAKALDPTLSVALRIPSERPGSKYHEDRFFLVISKTAPPAAKGKNRDAIIEDARLFPLGGLPNGEGPNEKGAAMAWGHRRKLVRLLAACREDARVRPLIELIKSIATA